MGVIGLRKIEARSTRRLSSRRRAASIISRPAKSMFCNSQPDGSANCRGST